MRNRVKAFTSDWELKSPVPVKNRHVYLVWKTPPGGGRNRPVAVVSGLRSVAARNVHRQVQVWQSRNNNEALC